MTNIHALRGDITKVKTDAIVNAANSSLMGGGGVDGAIHRAGGPVILEECREIINRQGKCKTGMAVMTNAGNLPARKVIHTVGPIYNNGKEKEAQQLADCYNNCLNLVVENDLKSVAFPSISTGVYGYPKGEAAMVAVNSVKAFINHHPNRIKEIILVCFDEENYNLYQNLLEAK